MSLNTFEWSTLTTTLGSDLRSLRKARGLTLSELSQSTGRSLGWLSQIERDISHPNIDELRNLSTVLKVPLSIFFTQSETKSEEAGRIVRKNSHRQITDDKMGLKEELLSPDLTDNFEIIRSVFAPKAAQSQYIIRKTQEVGYITSGSLHLWLNNEIFKLNEGDSFRIRNEPFKWENPYATPAVVIWVISPPIY